MTTSTWHADATLLRAYTEGRLDAVVAASLERHLDRCAGCRRDLPATVGAAALAAAWDGVRTRVESPTPPLSVRIARRCGLSESRGVLLAATASLRTAWLTSALVVVAFTALAAALTGVGTLAPFLLVAPLVPVLGVAAAYGPTSDPLETLGITTPYGRTRLVLERTLAIVLSVVPAAMVLGLVVPGPPWLAVAWLGPALAMVPLALALGSFVGPRTAGALVSLGWSATVAASIRLHPTWPVEVDRQVVYLVLAAASVVVLVLRSRQTHRMGAVL